MLLDGPSALLEEITAALRNPKWGVWLGRKCCLAAGPLVVAPPGNRATVWRELLRRSGFFGDEPEEQSDRIIEVSADTSGADMIDDNPLGFGRPIGERHAPRWVLRVSASRVEADSTST
ncbi:MAG: hypothetical protein KF791_01075 [Verrucomicrobiae bacterium]|nr:hypothetical protein [Verrucomicrobiae bacterium]